MSISGKPRDLCLRALNAAQGIPDIAFEFIMTGQIPEVPIGGEGGEADYGDEEMMGDEGGDGGEGGNPLAQYNLDAPTM